MVIKNELIDRSSLDGFKRYMLENPIYYKSIYGNIPIEEAYKLAMKALKNLNVKYLIREMELWEATRLSSDKGYMR